MTISGTVAMLAWANARADLVGDGMPVSGGFYQRNQRSPASGTYARATRFPNGIPSTIVAEQSTITSTRILFEVYALVEEAAELGASALLDAIKSLTGAPVPCGATGVSVLVSDNYTGPTYVQEPADGGENYCYQVEADFLLAPS